MMTGLVAGIDAGGTTFKCGVFSPSGALLAKKRVPTTTPQQTVDACATFFAEQAELHGKPLTSLGMAAFGPLNLDQSSSGYGSILQTTKKNWSHFPLRAKFGEALGCPVFIETDVNAALLAEIAFGAARGANNAAYITVGTGIGAGIYVNGGLVGRPSHPEFGHIRLRRHPRDTTFEGVCPFHKDCLEGLASAPAFTARHGDPTKLRAHHIGWEIEAYYLAQACVTLSLSLRPQRIVLGGGLLQAQHLLALIQKHYHELMNHYLLESEAGVQELIVYAGLGDDAGLLGGALLAGGQGFDPVAAGA